MVTDTQSEYVKRLASKLVRFDERLQAYRAVVRENDPPRYQEQQLQMTALLNQAARLKAKLQYLETNPVIDWENVKAELERDWNEIKAGRHILLRSFR